MYKLSPKLGDTIRLKFRGKDGHIDEKDFTRAKKMQEISLITIEIATKARQSAGIEFAADK